MPAFFEKALPVVLNALGSVIMLITVGMLAILVGAIGAFFGFAFAWQRNLPVSVQYGLMALCAILAPIGLGVWLWQRFMKLDDGPPRSS
jgi:EamA domain-containing membrane protein RarD